MLPSQTARLKSARKSSQQQSRSGRLIIAVTIAGLAVTTTATVILWPEKTQPGTHEKVANATPNIASNERPEQTLTQQRENSLSHLKSSVAEVTDTHTQRTPQVSHESKAGQPQIDVDSESPIEDFVDRFSATSSNQVNWRIQSGMELMAQNEPLQARVTLSSALQLSGTNHHDAERIRNELLQLNNRLVFSPDVVPGDRFSYFYEIESGDVLSKLPRKLGVNVDWRFLQRINGIDSPNRIRVGQRIKIVSGPFHAVVIKSNYRMDLYMVREDDRVFVRSFSVGLGEYDSTPEGLFVVKPNSKIVNPEWVNPRTGERFGADDPANPIGERWIGLVGVSDAIRGLEGYGIHGTIEPESIGSQRSMGCIRLAPEDVELVYELLTEGTSHVEIQGELHP